MFSKEQIKKIEEGQKAIQKGINSIMPDMKVFVAEFNKLNKEAQKQRKRMKNRLEHGARRTNTDII